MLADYYQQRHVSFLKRVKELVALPDCVVKELHLEFVCTRECVSIFKKIWENVHHVFLEARWRFVQFNNNNNSGAISSVFNIG